MTFSSKFVPALFLLVPLWSNAQDHVHRDGKPVDTAPITITINPESRVSVVLSGRLPDPTPCGVLTIIPIKIINQSFSTLQLEASLIDDSSFSNITIDFHPASLKGIPEESRSLGIKLSHPGPIDVTLSFGARYVAHDLGGRDRIHFMMRCLSPN
ncbi:hypothetical protein [Terriglobus sp. RCC_193]|uniref:hypothetical protein n=1 Tax=Terriglobus sp. RCC_193 TaxID=3239218 RepID=UPI0035251925